MSTTTSTSSAKGFSVLQPTLGAPLSFLPAVGTKQLDAMIDAYVPGPASPQEKRAAVALDFFEYSARTGQNFKYFAIPVSAAASPTGAAASPALSDLTYASPSSQASAPATPASKTARSAKRPETTDFSHLPGMKIITLDGQDVTNFVTRGCKTKEQRDHAHLMRILKVCDACKKKKIRCDPSHKKRSASQIESAKSDPAKPARKSRKKSASKDTPKSDPTNLTPAPSNVDGHPQWAASLQEFTPAMDDWDHYFTFDGPLDATLPEDLYNAVPTDFNFFFEPETQFSPATSGSSAVSPAQPLTPTGSEFIAPQNDFSFDNSSFTTFAPTDGQEAMLPYLASDAYGSNYVDFNLFSPSASFIDEEPRDLQAGNKRTSAASPVAAGWQDQFSPLAASVAQSPSAALASPLPQRDVGGESASVCAFAGLLLPCRMDNASHCLVHGESPTAIPHDLQQAPIDSTASAFAENHNLSSSSVVVASASMALEGVSPSAGSKAIVRQTGFDARTNVAWRAPVSALVRRPDWVLSWNTSMLMLEQAPQVLDGQQPSPLPNAPEIPSAVAPASSSHRQDQPTPTGGLISVDRISSTGVAQRNLDLPAVSAPIIATELSTSTALHPAGLRRGDSLLQEISAQGIAAGTPTAAAVVSVHGSATGPGSVRPQGLSARSILPNGTQQPTKKVVPQPLLDGVSVLPSLPVQPSSVESTAASVLSVLAQFAVFGLVSLLLIVAVFTPSNLQQLQAQLQYPPAFASLSPISVSTITMMLYHLLSTLSSVSQDDAQAPVFGKHGARLGSVFRSLLGGSSSSSSPMPSALRMAKRQRNTHSLTSTSHRVMVCV